MQQINNANNDTEDLTHSQISYIKDIEGIYIQLNIIIFKFNTK